MNSQLLKELLKDLIPAIKGDWFLSDGGMLGIERSGDLIPYDNDLDIYLLPGSFIDINILKKNNLCQQKYYLDTKIYNPKNPKNHLSSWREYCSYYQVKNKHLKLNRSQILKRASEDYRLNKIKPEFTLPYIDIFYLTKDYKVPHWYHYYYNEDELNIEENFDLGFKIYLPSNRKNILKRLYGENWRIPNPNFQHTDIEFIKETVL
jgi:hypothetical protein